MDAGRLAAAVARDPRPPQSVTRLQVKRQLEAMNLWGVFGDWLDANPDQAAEWDLATEIRIDDALTLAVAAELGMSQGDVDAFFRGAVQR